MLNQILNKLRTLIWNKHKEVEIDLDAEESNQIQQLLEDIYFVQISKNSEKLNSFKSTYKNLLIEDVEIVLRDLISRLNL